MTIDTNVHVGRWPPRRLPDDEPHRLAKRLLAHQVSSAWVGSFDALLHTDLGAVNARLSAACRAQEDDLFVPFGAVNPLLPDWEEDLRRCRVEYQMPGVRLHPNYHGYRLSDEPARQLLERCADERMIVQIAVMLEDERTQHPLLRVPAVDVGPLVDLLERWPSLRVVLLGGTGRGMRTETIDRLAAAGALFDIAMLEGTAGVARLAAQIDYRQIVFGSLAPLFYFESAWLKLRESALGGAVERAVRVENAQRLLAGPY